MGILFALSALILPRVMLAIAFLMTDWFQSAFETRLWPIMGFLFMPYSTLAYMAAMLNNHHALTGGWLVLVIVAVLIDMGHWGGSGRTYRRRGRR